MARFFSVVGHITPLLIIKRYVGGLERRWSNSCVREVTRLELLDSWHSWTKSSRHLNKT